MATYRDDQLAAGHVPADEAKAILCRYNASHFRNPGQDQARYTIPADPKRDDDIRLSRFIAQYEIAIAALKLIAEHGDENAREHARATLAVVECGPEVTRG